MERTIWAMVWTAFGWARVRAFVAMWARVAGASNIALRVSMRSWALSSDSRIILVVVGGLGEGDEEGGLTGGGQLGHGAGAGAAEDEVGLGEAGGHVVEIGADLPAGFVCAGFEVGLAGGLFGAGAGLVEDGEAGHVAQEREEDLRHRLVEDAGALAAAED